MALDMPTLLWALTITSSVLTGSVLAVAWRSRTHLGLTLWGLGLLVNALSYPLFALRTLGWPEVSIVLSNLFTPLTIALHSQALMQFQRDQLPALPRRWIWWPVVVCPLVALLLVHDNHWRNMVNAGIHAMQAALMAWLAWGPGLKSRRVTGRLIIVGGVSLLVVMMLGRVVSIGLSDDFDGVYKVPPQVQSLTYLILLAVLLLNTMGFVLMQMERAIDRQRDLATHDALTGAYNRRELMDAIDRSAAQATRQRTPLSLLMIDIDHFKRVNDEHSHLAGDQVLVEVARRAQSRLRRQDVLARFGGEEFVVLLPGTGEGGARQVAEDLRRAIGQEGFRVNGATLAITISVGVHTHAPLATADTGGPAPSADALLARCDEAVYLAKDRGRNRVEVVT